MRLKEITRRFLNSPERFFKRLFERERTDGRDGHEAHERNRHKGHDDHNETS